MRIFTVIIVLILFVREFLYKSSHHKLYFKYFNDKELHFLAFFIIPLFVYYVLGRNNNILRYVMTLLFMFLTYYIEVLQKLSGLRIYSVVDFKYSVLGFCLYLLFILGLKALSYTSKAAV